MIVNGSSGSGYYDDDGVGEQLSGDSTGEDDKDFEVIISICVLIGTILFICILFTFCKKLSGMCTWCAQIGCCSRNRKIQCEKKSMNAKIKSALELVATQRNNVVIDEEVAS